VRAGERQSMPSVVYTQRVGRSVRVERAESWMSQSSHGSREDGERERRDVRRERRRLKHIGTRKHEQGRQESSHRRTSLNAGVISLPTHIAAHTRTCTGPARLEIPPAFKKHTPAAATLLDLLATRLAPKSAYTHGCHRAPGHNAPLPLPHPAQERPSFLPAPY
jgi:hypothetical protein